MAFTLTVTGTNFIPQSVVDWNGGARATTYRSATSLSAAIQASDIATAGTVEITVVSFGANGGVAISALFPFTINPSSMSAAQFPQVVSVSAAGGPANGPSEAPAISADGRYVAFYSQAKNLVTPRPLAIFLCATPASARRTAPQDRRRGRGARRQRAQRQSRQASAISGDGRFVAFISRATNLVPGDAVVVARLLGTVRARPVRRRQRPFRLHARHRNDFGRRGRGRRKRPSASPSISGDGRYIAFVSAATNLGGGAIPPSLPQVYIRDTCEGPTATKSCVPAHRRRSG